MLSINTYNIHRKPCLWFGHLLASCRDNKLYMSKLFNGAGCFFDSNVSI